MFYVLFETAFRIIIILWLILGVLRLYYAYITQALHAYFWNVQCASLSADYLKKY